MQAIVCPKLVGVVGERWRRSLATLCWTVDAGHGVRGDSPQQNVTQGRMGLAQHAVREGSLQQHVTQCRMGLARHAAREGSPQQHVTQGRMGLARHAVIHASLHELHARYQINDLTVPDYSQPLHCPSPVHLCLSPDQLVPHKTSLGEPKIVLMPEQD
jgi:hypothetical protein